MTDGERIPGLAVDALRTSPTLASITLRVSVLTTSDSGPDGLLNHPVLRVL
jgi:hypothetical protein